MVRRSAVAKRKHVKAQADAKRKARGYEPKSDRGTPSRDPQCPVHRTV